MVSQLLIYQENISNNGSCTMVFWNFIHKGIFAMESGHGAFYANARNKSMLRTLFLHAYDANSHAKSLT